MSILIQRDSAYGRIAFLDTDRDNAEVACIEPSFACGWVATVGEDNPDTVWDAAFVDYESAKQAVYVELIRRRIEKEELP